MAKRISVSVPHAGTLREIDRAAKRVGESRSEFLLIAAALRARMVSGKLTAEDVADMFARLGERPVI